MECGVFFGEGWLLPDLPQMPPLGVVHYKFRNATSSNVVPIEGPFVRAADLASRIAVAERIDVQRSGCALVLYDNKGARIDAESDVFRNSSVVVRRVCASSVVVSHPIPPVGAVKPARAEKSAVDAQAGPYVPPAVDLSRSRALWSMPQRARPVAIAPSQDQAIVQSVSSVSHVPGLRAPEPAPEPVSEEEALARALDSAADAWQSELMQRPKRQRGHPGT